MTPNTKGSWWVPFEIGVAREAPRIITSYTNLDMTDLPEYLKEWPVLTGDRAVDTFAEHYKRGAALVKRAFLESRTAGEANVQQFHRQLKASLGQ